MQVNGLRTSEVNSIPASQIIPGKVARRLSRPLMTGILKVAFSKCIAVDTSVVCFERPRMIRFPHDGDLTPKYWMVFRAVRANLSDGGFVTSA